VLYYDIIYNIYICDAHVWYISTPGGCRCFLVPYMHALCAYLLYMTLDRLIPCCPLVLDVFTNTLSNLNLTLLSHQQLSVLLSFRFLAGADRRCQRAQGARDTCGARGARLPARVCVRTMCYLSIIVRQLQYLSIIVHKLSGGPEH